MTDEEDKTQRQRWLIYNVAVEAYSRTLPGFLDSKGEWILDGPQIRKWATFHCAVKKALNLDPKSEHARVPSLPYDLQCDALKLLGRYL